MDDYYSDNQPELIHCDNCGEDYAATYRACPFCHTAPNGKKVGGRSRSSSRAGNRVRTNTRGGGYGGARSPLSIVGIVLSIILAVAAIVIVVVLVKSVLSGRSNTPPPTSDQSGITSQEQNEPENPGEDTPAVIAPDSLTLDQTEVTLNAGETATLAAAIAPEGWIGQVIWSSSDAAVATVDQSGVVTYVGAGTCTITASAGGVNADCTVHCADAAPAEPSEPTEPEPSGLVVKAFGNAGDDFTIKVGEVIPFKAEGGDGANYTWTVADAGIASVDASGNCTGVSVGKTTLTVSSGGESVTVTIRIKAAS